jgi:hypothetical protein
VFDAMDLEPSTTEKVQDRCEECGAALTAREIEIALERGGPSLCSVHAAETAPAEELDPGVDL